VNKNKLLLIDVDSTVCDLVTPWIEVYNSDYHDNLQYDQISDYDLTVFVKPSCGKKIYNYLLDGGLYWATKPIPGALNGITKLRKKGYRPIFVTVDNYCNQKYEWLVREGFVNDSKDFVVTKDKSLIPALAIVDDNPRYLKDANATYRIMYNQPWNQFEEYDRAMDWDEVMFLLERYLRSI
jgi:5'(3')-deoxyribonucleotidase